MSKNKFIIHGDSISISHNKWDFIATATIRDDYICELESVTWSKSGEYIYSNKLKCYLHIYIMKKWYGNAEYERFKTEGYIIDHMDNDGYNCCIDNLCFLASGENIAKGSTLDKYSKNKTHIALSLYKDFLTGLIQMTIAFNYPAKLILSSVNASAIIETAYFLYDLEYEMVINDARKILYDYHRDFSFDPEKLHDADFHIEGRYGNLYPIDIYNKYIVGGHGCGIFFFVKRAPISNWSLETRKQYLYLSGRPENNS